MASITEAARTLEDDMVQIIVDAIRGAKRCDFPASEYDIARNAARRIADLRGMAER